MEMKDLPNSVFPSLPSFKALRQIIIRERKKLNILINLIDGENDSHSIQS